MNAKNQERYYCLDLFKGIACIFVVFMHCEFPGKLGTIVQAISRFCVPFFFMVSGYFCYSESHKVEYFKKIKHIAIITLCTFIFYTILALVFERDISVTSKEVIDWLLFNDPIIIVGQMWFLFALLYVYVVFALIEKLNLTKYTLYIVPVLCLAYISLAQGMHIIGVSVPNHFYRNWLIEGLLFFTLGYWIHRKWSTVKLPNAVLIVGIAISTILCVVERELLGRDFGVNICSFPQVVLIFLYCIKNKEKGNNNGLMKLGRDYSLYVYVFHPAIWNAIKLVYSYTGLSKNVIAQYCMPILVVIISILWSVIFCKVISQMKKIKRGRT